MKAAVGPGLVRVLVAVVAQVDSVPVVRPAVQVVAVLVGAALPALNRRPVVSPAHPVVVAVVAVAQLRVRLVVAVAAAKKEGNPSERNVKSLSSRQRLRSVVFQYLVVTTRRSRSARAHPSLTSLRRSM